MTVQERFWSKVIVTENPLDCWIWTRQLDVGGYGAFGVDGKMKKAHRVAYEQVHGRIPDGLCLDHLCRNRRCVNPSHLEAVTNQENIRRGLTGKINHRNSKKTACPLGHAFGVEPDSLGRRFCPTCRRNRREEARSKLAALTGKAFIPYQQGKRANRGEAHGMARITSEIATAIRSEYAAGKRQVDIAGKFGVTQSTVSLIVLRKIWRDAP